MSRNYCIVVVIESLSCVQCNYSQEINHYLVYSETRIPSSLPQLGCPFRKLR